MIVPIPTVVCTLSVSVSLCSNNMENYHLNEQCRDNILYIFIGNQAFLIVYFMVYFIVKIKYTFLLTAGQEWKSWGQEWMSRGQEWKSREEEWNSWGEEWKSHRIKNTT